MNVSLTPELEAFVHSKVESGRYGSASEVIRHSLRLLEEKDRLFEQRLRAFDEELQKGIDDLKAGRYTTLRTKEDFEALADEIKSEGLKLAAKRRGMQS